MQPASASCLAAAPTAGPPGAAAAAAAAPQGAERRACEDMRLWQGQVLARGEPRLLVRLAHFHVPGTRTLGAAFMVRARSAVAGMSVQDVVD